MALANKIHVKTKAQSYNAKIRWQTKNCALF